MYLFCVGVLSAVLPNAFHFLPRAGNKQKHAFKNASQFTDSINDSVLRARRTLFWSSLAVVILIRVQMVYLLK